MDHLDEVTGAIRTVQLRKRLVIWNGFSGEKGLAFPQSSCEPFTSLQCGSSTVLILGETGTGKELIVGAIHQRSRRKDKPLVRVNCTSIPRELFESEFFGHAKGAFTGAIKDRAGRFEVAAGGTLFLDEVGEIPLELQSKLLRVLQENWPGNIRELRNVIERAVIFARGGALDFDVPSFGSSVDPISFEPRDVEIVPLGRGHFPHDSRHFVPGYYQAVPLGQNTFYPPKLCLT